MESCSSSDTSVIRLRAYLIIGKTKVIELNVPLDRLSSTGENTDCTGQKHAVVRTAYVSTASNSSPLDENSSLYLYMYMYMYLYTDAFLGYFWDGVVYTLL